jgi:predicted Co/Zn/Cd cation transporter (cation efflux family)
VETSNEKDAEAVAITRTLARVVVVLAAAGLGMYLLSRLGVHLTDGVFPVAVAVVALLSVAFLVRPGDG